ncbi:Aryl hydrocarbon receptor nuclear translocator [Schistosoma japonicum]|uniref:Aryl hydrocarbon receptor nuclear translocator n=1 Tax=Schistosoma japonicum TaxID=6182 RepID=A0A4Z2DY59_SCHJA|nr:Aryl hydrocarbon receptor nuclear translocator [Schistosoma japonicum]
MFYGSEMQQAKDGQLISRNFVIAMRCGSGVPVKNCVRGSDGQLYRFIEFCGDIVYQSDNNYPEGCHLFRGVCRPLEMANPTVTDNTKPNSQGNSFEKPTSPNKTISSADHVTLRIGANNLLITEVVGNSSSILGWNAKDLLDKHVEEFVTIPEQNIVTQSIQETIENGSSTIYINWLNYGKTNSVYLKAVFAAIQLNSFLYCIVCKLHSTESATLPQCKPESQLPVYKSSDYSELQVSSDETIPPFDWNDSFNYNTTAKIKPSEFSTGSHLKSNNNTPICKPGILSNVDEHYVTIPKSHADGEFHGLGTPYRPVQEKNGQHSLASNSTNNETTHIPPQSNFTETHQHSVFTLDSDNMIPVEMNETSNSKFLPNNIDDLEYSNTTTDGQDWRQLPLNISFSSMLSESGLPELFNPDYIKDLIKEDITDL